MTTGNSPNTRRPNAGRIALIAGPTASGKSDLALRLARALDQRGQRAVIINADSAQVYRDLKVLSARPDEAEMRAVPHRLYGAWDGAQPCSAADWAEAAKREIARAQSESAVPILCGGTGLYLKVLIEGIAPIPPIDPQVREKVRALPLERAWRHVQEEDPQAAARLEPGDRQRIARALEVKWSSGRRLSDWQARKSGGIGTTNAVHGAILLPERAWLYERCDRRFEAMVERGAIEEVEALLARRLDPDLPVMRAIGVREIAAFLRGESDRAQMIARASQATRNYAKRQYTWFRGQSPREWRRIESQNYTIENIFASLLRD